MTTNSKRKVRWLKGALREFKAFPERSRSIAADALDLAASGGKSDIAKPLKGLGSGVWELVLKERGDAYRVVYALQVGEDIWVIHAFQKKSKSGIATPKSEIDLIRDRIRRLKV